MSLPASFVAFPKALLACILLAVPARSATPRLVLNELCASPAALLLDPHSRQFSCWFEVANRGSAEAVLDGCLLSDDPGDPRKWPVPAGTRLAPGQCLLFWADGLDVGLHARFRLRSSGGTLLLSSPTGALLDRVDYPPQPTDLSYGRSGHRGTWAFQATPTPGRPNAGPTAAQAVLADAPQFSAAAGFHPEPLRVALNAAVHGTLHYSLDGSLPGPGSPVYRSPLQLDRTTVLRARLFPTQGLPSPCATATFFIGERFTLPVVSVALDPRHLWDEDIGMYALGRKASPIPPHYGANYREPWERPANVEFFETGGRRAFSQLAGLRIHGSVTRSVPQKSLGFFADRRYGAETFPHPLFPGQPERHAYRNFMLRNSGNDWPRTLFRDGLSHTLARGRMNLDLQDYRPTVLFLNGAYWGIQNLRERLDGHYLQAHHRVLADQVDLLEHFGKVQALEGGDQDYRDLLARLEVADPARPEVYRDLAAHMDLENFIDYHILEIFVGNVDWPVGNVKLWRPRTKGARWRWMLYDTDLGFGLDPVYGAEFDMVWLLLDPVGDPWPNPPWSTLLFRRLARSAEFRRAFLNRFEQHLASTFQPDRVIATIDALQAALEPEMQRQIDRWKGQSDGFLGFTYPDSLERWRTHVEALRAFARERPAQVRRHLAKHFAEPAGTRP